MTALIIIESNPSQPGSLSKRLMQEGFHTYVLLGQEFSLSSLSEMSGDLILCEHDSDGQDGLAIFEQISQVPELNALPKILISEVDDRTTFRAAMALGADDYIPQPYDLSEITASIRLQLKRKHAIGRGAQNVQQSLTSLASHADLKAYFETLQSQDLLAACSLYLIGIDQLNWFRSTSGSQFSEKVLEIFASRLMQCNQALNHAFVLAKIDDQQFAIVARSGSEDAVCEALDSQWHQTLTQPLKIEEKEILITTSIAAIEIQSHDKVDFERVMSQSRGLIKRINKQGGNLFLREAFQASSKTTDQFAIATNLLQGLAEDEFHAYYQPQVDLQTGKFVGVEALVRWHHHEWGVLEPGRFIPVAEETGSIVQIDERVLRLACQAVHQWKQKGYQQLNVSVNLSARSFNRPDLSSVVESILHEYDVSPDWIELEITESMLVQDTAKAAQIMRDLKAVGVSLALDDFGVGYSSLSYLQQFPLDTLKIDQCFVQKVDSNRGNAAITEAVVKLSHSLNLKVVAEGVERVEEREFLKQKECDVMQGYLISPPVPKSVFETFLAAQSKTTYAMA